MKIKFVNFSAVIACLLVSGCANVFEPQVFGVSQSTWDRMSEPERQAVIEGYNRRKQTEAEYAPVDSLIGVLGTSLNSKKEPSFDEGMDFPDLSLTNRRPTPPTFPEFPRMPATNYNPQDCVEINEVRDGVSYREVRCSHTQKKTSSSFSFE